MMEHKRRRMSRVWINLKNVINSVQIKNDKHFSTCRLSQSSWRTHMWAWILYQFLFHAISQFIENLSSYWKYFFFEWSFWFLKFIFWLLRYFFWCLIFRTKNCVMKNLQHFKVAKKNLKSPVYFFLSKQHSKLLDNVYEWWESLQVRFMKLIIIPARF